MGSARQPLKLDALPFHEAPPLDPAGPSENGETQTLAQAMADAVMHYAPATDTDALKILRTSFPDSPLGLRVAALAMITRRRPRGAGTISLS